MSKNLSLAFIRQSYRPDGGAERILERTLAAMAGGAMDGHDIRPTVIARRWPGQQGGVVGESCELRVISDPGRYHTRIGKQKGFAAFACQTVSRQAFDLVQSHERVPCCDIYRAGDGVHREWLAQRARAQGPAARMVNALSPYHAYVKAAEKSLFESPRLKAVICNSVMVKEEIKRWFGYPDERLHVIYNGVDHARYSPQHRSQRRAVLESAGIAGQPFVFLFVGSGFERKGLAVALRALAKCAGDYCLLVIGADKRMGRYKALAKKLAITDRVYFLGVKQGVSDYYGAADALLLPTLYDPFPNVCTEAFASGLPVITSDHCGAAELITDGENGYVADALDVDALAGAMAEAMKNGRDHYARAAVETVRFFTLNNMVDKMVALYDEVLGQS